IGWNNPRVQRTGSDLQRIKIKINFKKPDSLQERGQVFLFGSSLKDRYWDWGCDYSPQRNNCDYSPHQEIVVFDTKSVNCEVSARLFSTADRCFPRARLQPPRETHSAGSSDTCCSRRSQRSSAPNNHRNSKSELYSAVANCTMLAMEIHVDSNGKAKRLLKKSM